MLIEVCDVVLERCTVSRQSHPFSFNATLIMNMRTLSGTSREFQNKFILIRKSHIQQNNATFSIPSRFVGEQCQLLHIFRGILRTCTITVFENAGFAGAHHGFIAHVHLVLLLNELINGIEEIITIVINT
jgi:hypothetical protein